MLFAKGREDVEVRPSVISGWLALVIKLVYEDASLPPSQVTGHSTHKMATSRAWAAEA